jgi:hypothetical protein
MWVFLLVRNYLGPTWKWEIILKLIVGKQTVDLLDSNGPDSCPTADFGIWGVEYYGSDVRDSIGSCQISRVSELVQLSYFIWFTLVS